MSKPSFVSGYLINSLVWLLPGSIHSKEKQCSGPHFYNWLVVAVCFLLDPYDWDDPKKVRTKFWDWFFYHQSDIHR